MHGAGPCPPRRTCCLSAVTIRPGPAAAQPAARSARGPGPNRRGFGITVRGPRGTPTRIRRDLCCRGACRARCVCGSGRGHAPPLRVTACYPSHCISESRHVIRVTARAAAMPVTRGSGASAATIRDSDVSHVAQPSVTRMSVTWLGCQSRGSDVSHVARRSSAVRRGLPPFLSLSPSLPPCPSNRKISIHGA